MNYFIYCIDVGYKDSDPEDCFNSLPKGLAEDIEMFASSSSSSNEDLSSHGKTIKALIGHSDNTSENESEDFEKLSKGKPYVRAVRKSSINSLAFNKEETSSKRTFRNESPFASSKRFHKSDNQLIEEEVLKYLARGPMNSKTIVKKLKRKLPDMHPENFLRNISCIMKSCNVEKHQMKDGKVIFKLK